MKRDNQNLSKKLAEYRKLYDNKEKEWNDTLQRLQREKEEEVQAVRDSFFKKRSNVCVIPVSQEMKPTQHLEMLKSTGQTHEATLQETDEINQHHFSLSREQEARIELIDKQCETRVAQIIATDDEFIAKQKKKKEKELAEINKKYEQLKLYITRLK